MRSAPPLALLVAASLSLAVAAWRSSAAQSSPSAGDLPPAEQQAKAALDRSPRHGEYVNVPLPGSERPLRAWVVYPERKDRAPVVVVIHEIFGLSDWIRAVADQLAKEGYLAIAPDLISGKGPGGGGTEALSSRDDVVKLVTSLTPAEVRSRLDAAREFATALPAASPKVGTVGFCWGGGQSFTYATEASVKAAVVYYGTPPPASVLQSITAPILGLYGGDDARVTSTVEPTKAEMAKLGTVYETAVYPGAGHGFLRAQEGRDGANSKASQQAWPKTVAFFKRYLQ